MKKILFFILILATINLFFIPITEAQTERNPFIVVITPSRIAPNEPTTITAKVFWGLIFSSATVNFTYKNSDGPTPSDLPPTCFLQKDTPMHSPACSVVFTSPHLGWFDITATASISNINFTAKNLIVVSDQPQPPLPFPPGQPQPAPVENYKFLAPLGEEKEFDPGQENAFGKYLNLMLRIFIGFCAVLAVVMIVIGGIEYMTSELISSKEAGKERITGALFGLVIALGAYALLNTINPDLLRTKIYIPDVTILYETQVRGRLGLAECKPIKDSTSPCFPKNLERFFGNSLILTHQASAICEGESGGVPDAASRVDMCKDKNSFSFGLFQINILAHKDSIPGGVCSNIFQTNGKGGLGACLKSDRGVCVEYDCSVIDPEKYRSCINYITNISNNITFAASLQKRGGWNQWGFNKSCRF